MRLMAGRRQNNILKKILNQTNNETNKQKKPTMLYKLVSSNFELRVSLFFIYFKYILIRNTHRFKIIFIMFHP